MRSKNITVGLLVLFIVSFGYLTITANTQDNLPNTITQTAITDGLKDYFTRNQDCLKYKKDIVNKLETKESPFGEASLEQIFYSPKQNSCLYVEHTIKYGYYNRRLFDILNDGYSAKPIEMCSSLYPSEEEMESWEKLDGNLTGYFRALKACDDFDEKVTRYKQK